MVADDGAPVNKGPLLRAESVKGKNFLDNPLHSLYITAHAEVVELVDALRSGRSGSNPVGVQIPPSAPF